ncbi:MAG: hypothetical protein JWO43_469 [Candidatus Adlerbacteria bacterium]|nr:hypothetical protein [Candidatus Adlerbacteria bacterium]
MGLVLGVVLVVGGFVYLRSGSAELTPGPTTYTGSPFPNIPQPVGGTSTSAQGQAPVLAVKMSSGRTLNVNDFRNLPATATTANIPGYYYLAGGINPANGQPPHYQTFYSDSDQTFHITLYEEPLAQYRAQAEQELMHILGISPQQMCALKYVVATNNGVSPIYDGQNLGFSFCPGAVAL